MPQQITIENNGTNDGRRQDHIALGNDAQVNIRRGGTGLTGVDELVIASAGEVAAIGSRRAPAPGTISRVFIVHGHDNVLPQQVARFVERLGLEAVILQEQTTSGQTIIEMIERHTDVGFAIVLYTPDDTGATRKDAAEGRLQLRARQNVVFEHGFLIARLGRSRVAALVSEPLELPSDISGILYINADWKLRIAREMKAVDPAIDLNKAG